MTVRVTGGLAQHNTVQDQPTTEEEHVNPPCCFNVVSSPHMLFSLSHAHTHTHCKQIQQAHEGKLNPTSVVLEGSSGSCGGARINVDLSHMQTTNKMPFSLFPGQVVAVEGMNGTGRKLTAHRILEGAIPPPMTTSVRQLRQFHYDSDKQDGKPLKVLTACGPFTTSQSMDYQPFMDLLYVILDEAPDVVVLTGPFVDVRQTAVQSGKVLVEMGDEEDDASTSPSESVLSFENVFAFKISGLIEEALQTDVDDLNGGEEKGFPTQFVLVPALEDATAQWV